MWFYGVIFALSFTQTLPLPFYPDTYHIWYQGSTCNFNNGLNSIGEGCRETYTIYLGFFIVLTMFAACFDLADQYKIINFYNNKIRIKNMLKPGSMLLSINDSLIHNNEIYILREINGKASYIRLENLSSFSDCKFHKINPNPFNNNP